MDGSLSPEEKAEIYSEWWSQPMWKTHVLVFGGLGTMILGQIGLFVQATSGALGFTALVFLFLVVMVAGLAVAVVGLFLRRQAFNRLAYRSCRNCGQSNLSSSGFCRKCGVPLPGTPDAGRAAASLPSSGPK